MTSSFFNDLLSGLDYSVGHWNSMGYFGLWCVKHTRKPHILPFTEMAQFLFKLCVMQLLFECWWTWKAKLLLLQANPQSFCLGRGGPAQMRQVTPVPPTLPFLMQIYFVQVIISMTWNCFSGCYHLSFERRKCLFIAVCVHKDKKNPSALSKDKGKLHFSPL